MKLKFKNGEVIDVPSSINFQEKGDLLILTMSQGCVNANMQENRASFEAWSLVAKSNGYNKVKLEKEKNISIISKSHYNRFLYRALCFCELFEWFSLSDEISKEVEEFRKKYLESKEMVYNIPHKIRN